jgi:hypothetical protein
LAAPLLAAPIWLGLLGLGALGCHASVQAHASANGSGKDGEEVHDYDKPFVANPNREAELSGTKASPYALLGARQDLNYAGTPTETCKCLAVAVGQPNDPRFSWEAAVPVVDSNTQLVIAMTSQTIHCPKAKKTSLGASYQGYVTDGTSVMLLVEEAHDGRPVTSGGIVPRPAQGGALYIRPANKTIPYGSSMDGSSLRCRLPTETSGAEAVAQGGPNEIHLHPMKSKALQSGDAEEKAPPEDGLDALVDQEPEKESKSDKDPGSEQVQQRKESDQAPPPPAPSPE